MNRNLKGVHHIAFFASDYDKSYDFYVNKLGFSPLLTWGKDSERSAMLDIGGGSCLEMFSGGTASKPEGAWCHLALHSDDCVSDLERARSAGAEVTMEPTEITINADGGDKKIKIAFFKGPDGETLEFFQSL